MQSFHFCNFYLQHYLALHPIGTVESPSFSSLWYTSTIPHLIPNLIDDFLQIGISFSYAIWCVSFNLTVFMFARIVSGLSKANIAIILAIVSDTTTEKDRNRAMVREITFENVYFSLFIGVDWCGFFFGFHFRSITRCSLQSIRYFLLARFFR